jgi:prepilin-type N-terminal cleavage/methylation domain-containing protein/prepilin-type processing-associated H-X9-DG protein
LDTRVRLRPSAPGFTLIELLVVIAIIGILAGLIFPVFNRVRSNALQVAALSNVRQIGAAALLYSNEHEMELPGRIVGGDKWPKLLEVYLKDVRVYAAPGDPQNYITRKVDPFSNSTNNTSYIMNGYNELGALDDPSVSIRVNRLSAPNQTIMFGTPKSGSSHFYMDFQDGDNSNVLNLELYNSGANYVFADGSAHFMTETEYKKPYTTGDPPVSVAYGDWLWLADKNGAGVIKPSK